MARPSLFSLISAMLAMQIQALGCKPQDIVLWTSEVVELATDLSEMFHKSSYSSPSYSHLVDGGTLDQFLKETYTEIEKEIKTLRKQGLPMSKYKTDTVASSNSSFSEVLFGHAIWNILDREQMRRMRTAAAGPIPSMSVLGLLKGLDRGIGGMPDGKDLQARFVAERSNVVLCALESLRVLREDLRAERLGSRSRLMLEAMAGANFTDGLAVQYARESDVVLAVCTDRLLGPQPENEE